MFDKQMFFFYHLIKWLNFAKGRLWVKVLIVLLLFALYQYYLFLFFGNSYVSTFPDGFQSFLTKTGISLLSIYLIFFVYFPLFKKRSFKILILIFFLWFFTLHSYSVYLEVNNFCIRSYLFQNTNFPAVECEVSQAFENYGILAPLRNSYTFFYFFFYFSVNYLFFFFALYGYLLIKENMKILELKKISNSIEISFLKNQISPHFLFNGLNNIYGLLLSKNKNALDFIENFQRLLNFSFENIAKDRISIENEVSHVLDYLALENLRRKIPIQINIDKEELNKVLIAPFLFFSLIENAVKHGFKDELNQATLNISIRLSDNNINFTVVNSINLNEKSDNNNTFGLGLKNLKRQLEILYPQAKLTLNQNNNSRTYEAIMVIPAQY
jgi:two-component system, LytTR family, sensor kinase